MRWLNHGQEFIGVRDAASCRGGGLDGVYWIIGSAALYDSSSAASAAQLAASYQTAASHRILSTSKCHSTMQHGTANLPLVGTGAPMSLVVPTRCSLDVEQR